MSFVDLSKQGLITFGKGALSAGLVVTAFKLFTKTHPTLMKTEEEKAWIITMSGIISLADTIISSSVAHSVQTNGALGFFVSSMLTSVVIDHFAETR